MNTDNLYYTSNNYDNIILIRYITLTQTCWYYNTEWSIQAKFKA